MSHDLLVQMAYYRLTQFHIHLTKDKPIFQYYVPECFLLLLFVWFYLFQVL